jgi:hypothetical protein
MQLTKNLINIKNNLIYFNKNYKNNKMNIKIKLITQI